MFGFLNLKALTRTDRSTHSIAHESENVAKHVLESLQKNKGKEPYPLDIMQDCDVHMNNIDRGIPHFLEYLADNFLQGYTPPEELLSFIKKGGNFHKVDESIKILIRQAFLDIYVLQMLGVHFGVNEQKLKGLIYRNMIFGTNKKQDSLTGIIRPYITHKGKLSISIEKLLALLKQSSGSGTTDKPVCPFHFSDYRHEWIDEIWEYIQLTIIPLMKNTFRHSCYEWELFWSGNIEMLPTTETGASPEELPDEPRES